MKSSGNTNGARTDQKSESVVGGISEFASDVSTLLELQAKLLALDLNECVARTTTPVIVATVSLAFLFASLPVILAGLALVLAAFLKLSIGWTLVLTGLVVLVVSGGLVYGASARLRLSLDCLRRSREELVRNLSWLRTVLVHSGRSKSPRRF
jgi:uncharacterized membrane protein YqjE